MFFLAGGGNSLHNFPMDAGIFLLIGDETLRRLLKEGLCANTSVSLQTGTDVGALRNFCAGPGRVAAVFDAAFLDELVREAEGLFSRNPRILPLFIGEAPARTPAADYVPAGNIISFPLHLGLLVDRVNRHFCEGTPVRWDAERIQVGRYTLLPGKNILTIAGGKVIHLTEKERDILVRLEQAGGTAVDRQTLLAEIWGYAEEAETHTLETHIYRLRKKMEEDPANPRYLLTDGKGYRLAGGREERK